MNEIAWFVAASTIVLIACYSWNSNKNTRKTKHMYSNSYNLLSSLNLPSLLMKFDGTLLLTAPSADVQSQNAVIAQIPLSLLRERYGMDGLLLVDNATNSLAILKPSTATNWNSSDCDPAQDQAYADALNWKPGNPLSNNLKFFIKRQNFK